MTPEIAAILRAHADETLYRHVPTSDGRCWWCAQIWGHIAAPHPCPPVRIAEQILALTDAAS
jgi:hypothetical protein